MWGGARPILTSRVKAPISKFVQMLSIEQGPTLYKYSIDKGITSRKSPLYKAKFLLWIRVSSVFRYISATTLRTMFVGSFAT